LEDDTDHLAQALASHHVFGRVGPEQKRRFVDAAQGAGHVVAMTGDGVNDLLALKRADIGIAMGQGSAASRGVAQFVLLDGRFASLPAVVAEGRRVIGNIERVAGLFVTKSVYAFVLAMATGVALLPFPLLPRQLSLVGALTLGLPGVVLALEPNDQRASPGFMHRVLAVALPSGTLAAGATFAAYADARRDGANLAEARTTATVVLFVVTVWLLALIARPRSALRIALFSAVAGTFAAALTLPATRRYFEFAAPPVGTWLTSAMLTAGACAALVVAARFTRWPGEAVPSRSARHTGVAPDASSPPR
jgi:magnesium-transporting ATPase (P-type)